MEARDWNAPRSWPEWVALRCLDEEWTARNCGLLCDFWSEEDNREQVEEHGEDASWLEGEGYRVWAMGDLVHDSYITTAAHEEAGDAWDEAQEQLDEQECERAVGMDAAMAHLDFYRRAREFHGMALTG